MLKIRKLTLHAHWLKQQKSNVEVYKESFYFFPPLHSESSVCLPADLLKCTLEHIYTHPLMCTCVEFFAFGVEMEHLCYNLHFFNAALHDFILVNMDLLCSFSFLHNVLYINTP